LTTRRTSTSGASAIISSAGTSPAKRRWVSVADALISIRASSIISRESDKVNTYMRLETQQQQAVTAGEAIEKFDREEARS
jgi:hypothetical protein